MSTAMESSRLNMKRLKSITNFYTAVHEDRL